MKEVVHEASVEPDGNEKKVKFDASTQANPDTKRIPLSRRAYRIERSNGNPFNDLLAFVVIMGVLFAISLYVGPDRSKGDQEKKEGMIANNINRLANAVGKLAQTTLENRREGPCSLFVAPGSIPGTGLSLFAGREYQTGEVVVESPNFLSLDLPSKSPSFFSSIHLLGVLLKHHPTMSNIMGDLHRENAQLIAESAVSSLQLRASKPISVGEELLVPFELHPQSRIADDSKLYDHIPSQEDYDIADEIVTEALLSSKRMQWAYAKTHGSVSPYYLYSCLERSLAYLNKRVAALVGSAIKYNSKSSGQGMSSVFTSLQNKSLAVLQASGTCLDDVSLTKSRQNEDDYKLILNRDVKQGELIVKVPIHITKRIDDQTCLAPQNTENGKCRSKSLAYCFSHPQSTIMVCPLTWGALSRATDRHEANAELRWDHTAMKKKPLSEVLTAPRGSWVWNLYALRAIQRGEELRIAASPQQGSFRQIPDSLMNQKWLDAL